MSINGTTHKKTPQRSRVYWRWCLVLGYAGCIFALSAIPGDAMPAIDVNDKLLHAVEFGGLAFLLCGALSVQAPGRSRYSIMAISILATIGYSATDEAHQLLVDQRTSDLADLAADGLGAFFAAWVWVQAGKRWSWLH